MSLDSYEYKVKSTKPVSLVLHLNVHSNNMFVSVRGARPGKNVQLTENEIRGLCLKSREIFLSQPVLLELEAPLKICGKSFLYYNCTTTKYNVYLLTALTILPPGGKKSEITNA